MTKQNKIGKEMKIEEVLSKHPETLGVFEKFGFHCIGCMAASFESIEEGANAHKINVDEFIQELNKAIKDD